MIAAICLAIAAALLFWPEPKQAPEPLLWSQAPAPEGKPKRKRSPKNVAKN